MYAIGSHEFAGDSEVIEDWNVISNTGKLYIAYKKIDNNYILHIRCEGLSVNTIGQTIATIDLNAYPFLRPSFNALRSGLGGDYDDYSGRASVGLDFNKSDGSIRAYPRVSQMSGSLKTIYLYGDCFLVIH